MSRGTRPLPKDMYWFAHGGPESEKNPHQRNSVLIDGEEDASNSPTWNTVERRASPDEQRSAQNVTDGSNHSSGPASLERDDRLRISNKHLAVEERRKQLWEAEQERNDAVLKKHMERDAALEARRNASRSTIAFAFGSSVPRNVDTLQGHEGGDADIMSRSFTCGSSHREEPHNSFHDRRSVSPLNCNGSVHDICHPPNPLQSYTTSISERRVLSPPSCLFGSGALIIGEDVMSRSMTVSAAPRGRRKNDLMPTIPYERDRTINTSRVATSSSTRKRSVSMTRLDQLALPRKHYVEANKASSANTSMHKDNVKSPQRPLSSASENSGGSGRAPGNVTRRVRSTPRKPRPVSIAGTLPEQRQVNSSKPFEVKATPVKKTYTPSKLSAITHSVTKTSTPKPVEKAKQTPRLSTPPKINTPKPSTPRTTPHKPSTSRTPKPTENKTTAKQVSTPKTPVSKVTEKKPLSAKKKPDAVVASPLTGEVKSQVEDNVNSGSPPPTLDADVAAENEKNNAKRIISEEEAKAALAEKRRLAREQAEKEAELERQRLEQLRLEEEERLRQEEEEHKKMEEEQMRLLEEHRRQEEEKLRKAIEDQEQRAEEERAKRDEEMRLKAEQEKKAKEEAEKQRIELEEKLRKEEEERAERKKRLEKIMSRTRGKSSGLSPSSSMSGSDHLDSGENHQEGFSSGANSLESNEGDLHSEQVSTEDQKAEISLETNPNYEMGSENESLNSNDLMMPGSETASQDNSLVGLTDKVPVASAENGESAAVLSSPPADDVKGVQESPEVVESVGNHTVEVTEIAGMEEMMKSVMVEPSFAQGNASNQESEIDVQENLEVGQEVPEVLSPAEFAHDSQKQDFGDADSFLQVGSQQDFKEIEEPQILSGENESNQLVTSEETSSGQEMNLENTPTTVPFSEEVNMEASPLDSEMFENQGSSVASDMKLPDPIYETSEDGSISSEKQMIRMQEDFDDARNQENVLEDVAPLPDPESAPLSENPFEMNAFNANPFSDNYSAQGSNIDSNESPAFDMSGSIYEVRESNMFSQEHDKFENQEITESSQSPNLVEPDVHQNEKEIVEEDHNSENEHVPAAIISGVSLPPPVEEFHNGVFQNGHHNYEESSIFDNQLIKNEVSDSSAELAINNQPLQKSQSNQVTEAVTENQSDIISAFDQEETSDVTIIKAESDGACVGIISSIDHDLVSNDFPKPNLLNEQFINNFQSASMTDSEDNSSLDSNQSQVMTAGDGDKCVVEGLNHMDISASTKNGYSNGDNKHNPFDIGNVYNDSLSKSSVNNFHASEMYGNGHRSSQSASEQIGELPDYLHSSGNGLLSVDKNNIFESADAFGKVSPDPFLVKGSSNQNPFLMQDDQKQAFVAPDFLN